jgi:hypothetical protein
MSDRAIPPKERWLEAIADHPRSTTVTIAVGYMLSRFVIWKTLTCRGFKQSFFAKKLRIHPRTFQSQIAVLRSEGLLKVHPQAGNRNNGNVYVVILPEPRLPLSPTHDRTLSPMRSTDRMPYGARCAYNLCTEPLKNPSSSPPIETEDGERRSEGSRLDDEWCRFVGAYPFHGAMSMTDAKREFAKLSSDDHVAAVSAASRYRQAVVDRGRRHPLDAVNWLRKREWAAAPQSATRDSAANADVFIPRGSPEWDAWQRTWQAETGLSIPMRTFTLPAHGGEGVLRPTRWPPATRYAAPTAMEG